jgi:hypothetical protein
MEEERILKNLLEEIESCKSGGSEKILELEGL